MNTLSSLSILESTRVHDKAMLHHGVPDYIVRVGVADGNAHERFQTQKMTELPGVASADPSATGICTIGFLQGAHLGPRGCGPGEI